MGSAYAGVAAGGAADQAGPVAAPPPKPSADPSKLLAVLESLAHGHKVQELLHSYICRCCTLFSEGEEEPLVCTEVHAGYRELFERCLQLVLRDAAIDELQFAQLMQLAVAGGSSEADLILDFSAAADDYLAFKAMMLARRRQLEARIAQPSARQDDVGRLSSLGLSQTNAETNAATDAIDTRAAKAELTAEEQEELRAHMWGQQRKLRAERGADAPQSALKSARCSDAESSQSSDLQSTALRLDGSVLRLDASLPGMSEWLQLSEGRCGDQGPLSRAAATEGLCGDQGTPSRATATATTARLGGVCPSAPTPTAGLRSPCAEPSGGGAHLSSADTLQRENLQRENLRREILKRENLHREALHPEEGSSGAQLAMPLQRETLHRETLHPEEGSSSGARLAMGSLQSSAVEGAAVEGATVEASSLCPPSSAVAEELAEQLESALRIHAAQGGGVQQAWVEMPWEAEGGPLDADAFRCSFDERAVARRKLRARFELQRREAAAAEARC